METLRFVYRSDKSLFFTRFIITIIQSALPLVSLLVLKLLIDEVSLALSSNSETAISHILLYIIFFSGIFILSRFAASINQYVEEILSHKLIDYISNLIHKQSSELDLSFYDNPDYHDTFHRAQQEAGYRPMQLLQSLTGIIRNFLSLAGILFLLASFSWGIIIIMIIAGIPGLWFRLWKSKIMYNWRRRNTAVFRKAYYFSSLLTNKIFSKEVRINNLSRVFQKKFSNIRKILVREITSIAKHRVKLDLFSGFIEALALAFIIYFIAREAIAGAITIGAFVMLFEAFRRGQGFVQNLIGSLTQLYDNKLFITNLFEFLSFSPAVTSPEQPIPFPKTIKSGIRFENVSFKYPFQERMIIENFNCNIEAGKLFKIQGENGVGKTTLIKLICRFYNCTKGNIYIDEINIKSFHIEELRENIGVIFQDFCRFDFSVSENISLCDYDKSIDINRLNISSEISRAKQIIDELPHKYDTLLGRYFEGGAELSMGQWQRIALARAIYKNPGILVLDEPTSWIDDKSEIEFFENMDNLLKDRIVILISHSSEPGPGSFFMTKKL